MSLYTFNTTLCSLCYLVCTSNKLLFIHKNPQMPAKIGAPALYVCVYLVVLWFVDIAKQAALTLRGSILLLDEMLPCVHTHTVYWLRKGNRLVIERSLFVCGRQCVTFTFSFLLTGSYSIIRIWATRGADRTHTNTDNWQLGRGCFFFTVLTQFWIPGSERNSSKGCRCVFTVCLGKNRLLINHVVFCMLFYLLCQSSVSLR